MNRIKLAVLVAAIAVVAGLAGAYLTPRTTVAAQDKAQPEKISNIDAHLKADKDYQKADLAGRLGTVAQLLKDKRISWPQARGAQMREILADARANERDPASDLVPFVQWLGAELKNYKGDIRTACSGTGSLEALIETHGARRLYTDKTFLEGDAIAKLGRIKELWDARELAQGQCYELTAMYIYEYLAPAAGDIDKQIEMFGKLTRAKCMDWAGSAGVHDALLTRALEEKKDLDSVEKKLAWIGAHAEGDDADLSWMVVGRRRLTLFMHVLDATMAGLSTEERAAKIDEYKEKKLLGSTDASDLKATYCETK